MLREGKQQETQTHRFSHRSSLPARTKLPRCTRAVGWCDFILVRARAQVTAHGDQRLDRVAVGRAVVHAVRERIESAIARRRRVRECAVTLKIAHRTVAGSRDQRRADGAVFRIPIVRDERRALRGHVERGVHRRAIPRIWHSHGRTVQDDARLQTLDQAVPLAGQPAFPCGTRRMAAGFPQPLDPATGRSSSPHGPTLSCCATPELLSRVPIE
jgi:hypothetical protein